MMAVFWRSPLWRVESWRFQPGILLCCFLFAFGNIQGALATDSAVILLYHRFGEDSYPSTNITLDQFESHIAFLQEGGYTVLPLPAIVTALKSGQSLPERSVAITMDDGFRSIYDHAWPRLQAAGFPFTVFVSTDSIDRNAPDFMSWEQIRQLHDSGVTIGAHTASHLHMVEASVAENRQAIDQAQSRLREETGTSPLLFSFPYGESSPKAEEAVRQSGYIAAFGQQSGPVYGGSDFFLLPRFALNETYGEIERFKMILKTLPLPVSHVLPSSMVIGDQPPGIGFTVDPSIGDLDRLQCYPSHGEVSSLDILNRRVEIRVSEPLPFGRFRLNCTAPAPQGRWYWFGMMLYRPEGE